MESLQDSSEEMKNITKVSSEMIHHTSEEKPHGIPIFYMKTEYEDSSAETRNHASGESPGIVESCYIKTESEDSSEGVLDIPMEHRSQFCHTSEEKYEETADIKNEFEETASIIKTELEDIDEAESEVFNTEATDKGLTSFPDGFLNIKMDSEPACEKPAMEMEGRRNLGTVEMSHRILCALCNWSLHDIMDFKRHVVKNHPETDFSQDKSESFTVMCGVCETFLPLTYVVKRHMNIHSYSCEICNKQYPNREKLETHVRLHAGEKLHDCELCKKKFARKFDLKRHIQTHTSIEQIHCEICNKQFKRKDNLVYHMRSHHRIKQYSCDTCHKSFYKKDQLRVHVLITHLGTEKLSCEVCGKCIAHKSLLPLHMLTHKEVKPYSCQFCNKPFPGRFELERHERVHTGEKPFLCDLCSKTFARKCNLKKHMFVHERHKLNNMKNPQSYVQ